jgi:hypothetical protein
MFASCIVRAAIDVMRSRILIGVLVLGACATIGDEQPGTAGDLGITLNSGWLDNRPTLVASITNRSHAPLCIRAEALRNPWSNEIRLRLRDTRGRRVALHPEHGSSEPQLDQIVRLEPGATAQGQLYLERFKRVGQGRPSPHGWRVQAQVPYGNCQPREAYCDGRIGLCPDAWSSRAVSTWQPLSFNNRE